MWEKACLVPNFIKILGFQNFSGPLVTEKHEQISKYINLAQSHQKTLEIFTRKQQHSKLFVSHTG